MPDQPPGRICVVQLRWALGAWTRGAESRLSSAILNNNPVECCRSTYHNYMDASGECKRKAVMSCFSKAKMSSFVA